MIRPAIISAALLAPVMALAQPSRTRDPDWPCQQIKVSEISLAAVWSGPPVDLQDNAWKANSAIASLVETVAARREPIDQAQTALHEFAQHAEGRKQPQLLQVLVGVFDVLGQERNSVVAGLDRFGVRQKELADEIRGDNAKLRALQADAASDPKVVQQMTQQLTWKIEVFQDRRQSLSYACDVPGKIEQRLFTLAHQIQQELD
jgi:hypothetical protein